MAGATIANELALRDRPAAGSRYGPTDPTLVPPLCDAPLAGGVTADLTLDLAGTVDGRSLGVARTRGARSGQDFRWLAEVTTTTDVGLHGAAMVESRGWIRQSDTRWIEVPRASAEGESLDLRGPRGRPRPAPAHRGGGPRPRRRRGRPSQAMPRRRGRGGLPRRVPPGPMAGGIHRPGELAGGDRRLGLRRRAARAGRRAARRTGVFDRPGSHQGRAHGDPDGDAPGRRRDHRPTHELSHGGSMDRWDLPGGDTLAGRKRDRVARFYRVATYLSSHPDVRLSRRARPLPRHVAAERLPRPEGARRGARDSRLGRGRPLGPGPGRPARPSA